MEPFSYRQGDLYCENVRAEDIVGRVGTPTMVYSIEAIRSAVSTFREAFDPLGVELRYAIKSCPNVTVLRALAECGCGMAASSGDELELAWLSGCAMSKVVLSGPQKNDDNIRSALDGLYSPLFQAGFTVEGRPPYYRGPTGWLVAEGPGEVERIAEVAGAIRVSCKVAMRLWPDGFAESEPEDPDSKFGLDAAAALEAFRARRNDPRLRLAGLYLHLGERARRPDLLGAAADRVADLVEEINADGGEIELVDLGGGFGPSKPGHTDDRPAAIAEALAPAARRLTDLGAKVVIEPGRAIIAQAAVLLTRVLDVKALEDRELVICDAGICDPFGHLPSHDRGVIWPAHVEPGHEPPRAETQRLDTRGLHWTDIVGSGTTDRDGIARGRLVPRVEPGSLMALFGAGAYAREGIVNGPPGATAAEILVDGLALRVIRSRRTMLDDLTPELDAIQKGL